MKSICVYNFFNKFLIRIRKEAGMKKELAYFTIDSAYGGNQEWFTNLVMYMGGCGAATACDSCIYFALRFGKKELYPYDINALCKEEYKKFSQIMKPYIRPRVGGVRKLEWFAEGLGRYIMDVCRQKRCENPLKMDIFSGNRSEAEAEIFVKEQIDRNVLVPCLLLKHKDEEKFKDYIWHWFLIVGYEETEGDFLVKTATYGEAVWFSLKELWDTGCEEKGGFIKYLPLYE